MNYRGFIGNCREILGNLAVVYSPVCAKNAHTEE